MRLRGGKTKRGKDSGKRKGGHARKHERYLRRLRHERQVAIGKVGMPTVDVNGEVAEYLVDRNPMNALEDQPLHAAISKSRTASPCTLPSPKAEQQGDVRELTHPYPLLRTCTQDDLSEPLPKGVKGGLEGYLKSVQAAEASGNFNKVFDLHVRFGSYKEARRLLDAEKADCTHAVDMNSLYTPLHQAVADNDLIAAEMLLEYGADVFAVNSRFENPTAMAMKRGMPEMFQLLRKYGGMPEEVRRHKSRR